MRALSLTIIVLTSFGPSFLLAQDQGKATLTDSPTASANPPLKEKNNEQRVMERLGPDMDWDHRKPGRDFEIVSSA
jgi:hypothetical protein